MDPVTLIVAALVAGAATGSKDIAGSAVRDAYNGLKALLIKRFRNKAAAQPTAVGASAVDPVAVLEAYEATPDGSNVPLEDALKHAGADHDEEILAAAKGLLELADPQGAAAGKYQVDLRGAQGVQVGDRGQMTVNIGATAQQQAGPALGG